MLDHELQQARTDPARQGARPLVPRQAARARPAPRLQHDRHRLAGARRLRPPAQGPARAGAHEDGEARPRRAGVLRRRERPLHHERLPGQLEEQHLHPLLRAAARRRAGAVRDRGLRPRVREDRRSLAERQHPPRDHLEVGGDGRGVHGRQDGQLRARRAQGERRRERADRPRRLRPERLRGVQEARPEHRQRVAGHVRRAHRQDAGRDRVPEDLLARSATRRSGRSSTSGSSRASRSRRSRRRSTSTCTRRASTSSTTSSSPPAATPARTGAGTPTR